MVNFSRFKFDLFLRTFTPLRRLIWRLGGSFILFAVLTIPVAAQTVTVERIASHLQNPRGVAVLEDGRLLVVEAGTGAAVGDVAQRTGRVSVFTDLNHDGDFDDSGERVPVSEHIPTYNGLTQFNTGRDEVGGAGDIVLLPDGRVLYTYDMPHEAYAADGNTSDIGIMAISADWQSQELFVRGASTMNALTYDAENEILYIAESGANRLLSITLDGSWRVVVEFAPLEHGQQAVPAGLAYDANTGDVLVALFSGVLYDYFGGRLAYMPGAARIVRVTPTTGEQRVIIDGLTTAVDVVMDEAGNVYVVEMAADWPAARLPETFDLFAPDAPPDAGGYPRYSGRVTRYPADGGDPTRLADGLDQPTNITYAAGALYVSTGQGTPGRPIFGPQGLTTINGAIVRVGL